MLLRLQKKFVALIAVSAIAVTGFTAAPARASEDAVKTLLGLAVVGSVVANKRKDKRAATHQRKIIKKGTSRYYAPRGKAKICLLYTSDAADE